MSEYELYRKICKALKVEQLTKKQINQIVLLVQTNFDKRD